MRVTIRLFSIAKDLAGFREKTLQLAAGSRARDVLSLLRDHNPRFTEWENSIRLAVNQEYVPMDHPLRDGDEVAVIPPVSGG